MPDPQTPRLSGRAKALVDYGPLAVFLLAYFFGQRLAPLFGNLIGRNWAIADGSEMYLAIGLFMPAFALAFGYSIWREKRAAPMLMISGAIILVFGSLTLILKDKTFFYMKPTLVYLLFSALLAGGLVSGRNFMKTVFDDAFTMPEAAWRTLTVRFVIFFAVMALLNEIAWRYLTRECDLTGTAVCAGEAVWVNIKIFGFTIVSVIFTAFQIPFIMKHDETASAGS